MPSLSQRMRKLQTQLLAIRLGPGALVLPKDIKRIHMRFAQYKKGGHLGPRKFWKNELVRLKYHNPAVPMTIDRTALDTDSAPMSIHFAPANASQTSSSATSSPAPIDSTTSSTPAGDHDPTDRVETIEMKGRTADEILEDFRRLTSAYPIEATPEEKEELRALEEQRLRSERDRRLMGEHKEKVQRERELLGQAMGDVPSN